MKAYNDITVKDICEKSQISRTTFYTHYKTKDDFIYSYLNTLLKVAKRSSLKRAYDTSSIFKRMIYYWLSEGQLILMLLGDESAYKLHQKITTTTYRN